jgi:hypothetical protein
MDNYSAIDQASSAVPEAKDTEEVTTKDNESLWSLYKKSRIVKIELVEFDPIFKGYWVKARPTTSYEPSISEKLTEMEDETEQNRYAMRMWISDWNLPGLGGVGKLAVPSETNHDWEDVVPLELQSFIINKIQEVDSERVKVPTETGNEQSPP